MIPLLDPSGELLGLAVALLLRPRRGGPLTYFRVQGRCPLDIVCFVTLFTAPRRRIPSFGSYPQLRSVRLHLLLCLFLFCTLKKDPCRNAAGRAAGSCREPL